MVADCIEGRGDKAYETISKILPDSTSNPCTHSGCEPYVVTNMYFGPDNPRRGETLFAWVTGTAGWMFRAITQYMAGFHPSYDSFTVNPCIPKEWKKVTLTRKFRGDIYKLVISNENGSQSGVKQLKVDGKTIDGNRIGVFADGKTHTLEITM